MTTTVSRPKRVPQVAANVVAIASGKGGVGKTWFSITLAHQFAERGERVLLVDGDLGLANVDVQLGVTPEHDLRDVIDDKISIRRAITHSDKTGFDVLAGQSGSASLAALPVEQILKLRRNVIEIAKEYDRVLIDLGAGVERTVRILASAAGTTLVVTNDEPTALTDAYAFIKLTHTAGLGNTVRVIVNQASSKTAGEKVYQTLLKVCDNFLSLRPPLAGILRSDPKVPEAIRSQTPLLTRHPNTKAAEDIETIALGLSGPVLRTAESG